MTPTDKLRPQPDCFGPGGSCAVRVMFGIAAGGAFVFSWKNNPKRADLYGRRCHVLLHAARMSSVLVQFCDSGQFEVVSRRALRRV